MHCFLKTVLLSANQNWDIFSCILLTVKLSTKEIQIKARHRCNVGTKTSSVNNKSSQKLKSRYFRCYLLSMFSIRYSSICKILLIRILNNPLSSRLLMYSINPSFHKSSRTKVGRSMAGYQETENKIVNKWINERTNECKKLNNQSIELTRQHSLRQTTIFR